MSIPKLEFPPFHLPPEAEALRLEVRAFLKETLPGFKTEDRFASWNTVSPEFSRALGKKGWIGITWPKQYGGSRAELPRSLRRHRGAAGQRRPGRRALGGRPPVRPAAAALRQRGAAPGDPAAASRAGECFFSIGMSEPDSGSDLASVRTRAEPVPGGFRVNGTKVWTSGAHRNHYCIALVRTSGQHGDRHKGLSQILVDLKTPGVTIRPIINLAGRARLERGHVQRRLHSRELPDRQRGRRLAAGDERARLRALRSRALHAEFLRAARTGARAGPPAGQARRVILGRLVARLWTLRQMSVAVAGMMQGGKSPAIEAALVKDLGTIYQQDLPEIARVIAESDATTEDDMADFLDIAQYATMMAPSYTIQGGTTQVLRGIVARGLGLR